MADGPLVEVANQGDLSAAARRPLVTYRIQCYRHQAFVHEAVRSVLAQTYRPMEVLITDDASPDATFETARAAALAYRGPHRVVLYRGQTNRDIFRHWNDALPWLRGDFFLSLSGDDVAEPNQVEELVCASSAPCVIGAWSNYRVIDRDGRDCGAGLPSGHPYTLNLCDYMNGRFLDFPYAGAVGYSRDVIDRFGLVSPDMGSCGLEHHLGFRAALLGGKKRLDTALVRKRNHPDRATHGHNRRDRESDPMVVHERQIRVRLQVLLGCRDVIANHTGAAFEARHEPVVRALNAQLANETRRLLEFEAYREQVRRSISRGESPEPHSGWRYPPNAISFVRQEPGLRCNIVAGECMYFAVPWSFGVVEPCAIRNHALPGILRAWSEPELLTVLARRADAG